MSSTAIPRIMTSTPVSTPESSSDQFELALSSALDVIARCIGSNEKLVKDCEEYKAAGVSSPYLLRIIGRIQEDTQAVVNLKQKISQLNSSIKSGNLLQMRQEFEKMMRSVENISTEKMKMFSEVLCLTETSNVKKRFLETEKELNEMDETQLPDAKTKHLAKLLIERNKKMVRCLDYFNVLLPKLLSEQDTRFLNIMPRSPLFNQSQSTKKLYILGESLQQRLPEGQRASLIGKVIIEDESRSRQKSRSENSQQQEHRRLLSGFLEDDMGNLEEVRLQLIEPLGDLMNFSDTSIGANRTLTAKVEINGQINEKSLPVVEVDLSEDQLSEEAAKVIVIVENKETGNQQPVEMTLVQTSPGAQVHGRIVQLQHAVKPSKSNRALHQSFTEKRIAPAYNPNATQIYEGRFERPDKSQLVRNPEQSTVDYLLSKNTSPRTQKEAVELLEYISEPEFDLSDDQQENRVESRDDEQLEDISEPNFDDTLAEILASIDEQQQDQSEQLVNISKPFYEDSNELINTSEPKLMELIEQLENVSEPKFQETIQSFIESLTEHELERSAEELLVNITEPNFSFLEDSQGSRNASRGQNKLRASGPPSKSAKAVFKKIQRIVHTLAALGSKAISAEAQKQRAPSIRLDQTHLTPDDIQENHELIENISDISFYDSYVSPDSRQTSRQAPISRNNLGNRSLSVPKRDVLIEGVNLPPARLSPNRTIGSIMDRANITLTPENRRVNFRANLASGHFAPAAKRRPSTPSKSKLGKKKLNMNETEPDERNRSIQSNRRIRLRDRIQNRTLPSRPVQRPQWKPNQSLRLQQNDRQRPFDLTVKSTPLQRVNSRIPESDLSEFNIRPSLVGAFMDDTDDEIDENETFGHESDFSEINEVLDQPINNILSPYDRAEQIPLKMKSMRQTPEAHPVYNRSLPSHLSPRQDQAPRLYDAEQSLNSAYRDLIRHVDEHDQPNFMNLNQTYDMALSESFEEIERQIAAEEAADAEMYRRRVELAGENQNYKAEAAEAFAARHMISDDDLNDINLSLVDD